MNAGKVADFYVRPVEIVRPKLSRTELVGKYIGSIGWFFTAAWILMVILGSLSPFHPGYWQTLVMLIGFRVLTGNSSYLSWTRGYRKGE